MSLGPPENWGAGRPHDALPCTAGRLPPGSAWAWPAPGWPASCHGASPWAGVPLPVHPWPPLFPVLSSGGRQAGPRLGLVRMAALFRPPGGVRHAPRNLYWGRRVAPTPARLHIAGDVDHSSRANRPARAAAPRDVAPLRAGTFTIVLRCCLCSVQYGPSPRRLGSVDDLLGARACRADHLWHLSCMFCRGLDCCAASPACRSEPTCARLRRPARAGSLPPAPRLGARAHSYTVTQFSRAATLALQAHYCGLRPQL